MEIKELDMTFNTTRLQKKINKILKDVHPSFEYYDQSLKESTLDYVREEAKQQLAKMDAMYERMYLIESIKGDVITSIKSKGFLGILKIFIMILLCDEQTVVDSITIKEQL